APARRRWLAGAPGGGADKLTTGGPKGGPTAGRRRAPPGLGDLVKGSATGLCAAIITAVDLD
ncbi:hypothetical protein, partial [Pseudomonas aeruginosa]|uniref:hypothetical protein n=1 Tax=Pseudomonas aeruginosa TaxID=287 RepID=UPI001C97D7E4